MFVHPQRMMTFSKIICVGVCVVCYEKLFCMGTAYETHVDLSSSDAIRTCEWVDSCSWFSLFALSPCPFLLCLLSSFALEATSTISDKAAPRRSVHGLFFPGWWVDAKVLKTVFQSIFESLLLSANISFSFSELTVEKLFRNSVVWHSCDMACPSDPVFSQLCLNAWEICPFQYLSIWYLVLYNRKMLKWSTIINNQKF